MQALSIGSAVRLLRQAVFFAAGMALLWSAPAAAVDFELTGSEHLDVRSVYANGCLRDTSTADVFRTGTVASAQVLDSATMTIHDGRVDQLGGFGHGAMSMAGGTAGQVTLQDDNTGDMVEGYIPSLSMLGNARMTMSDGLVLGAQISGEASWNITGGRISSLTASGLAHVILNAGPVKSSATITSWVANPDADWILGGSAGGNTFAIDFGDEDTIRADLTMARTYSMRETADLINDEAGYYAAKIRSNEETGMSTLIVSAQYGGPELIDISSTQMGLMGADFTATYGTNYGGGGRVNSLQAEGSSRIDLLGGQVAELQARDSSIITIRSDLVFARDGLTIEGDLVLGTGTLWGLWMDGSDWSINIPVHDAGATIMIVPEPAVVAMLLCGLGIVRRRRR